MPFAFQNIRIFINSEPTVYKPARLLYYMPNLMKNVFLLLLFFSTAVKAVAQFQNKIQNGMQNGINNLEIDDNGNIIYSSFIPNDDYLVIYKSDSLNNPLFQKKISFGQGIQLNFIRVVDNQIYILTYPQEAYCLLTKLDTDGNFLWSKKITGPLSPVSGGNMRVTADNNIYIYFGSCDYENTFIKFDADGNLIWAKSYLINPGTHWYRGVVRSMIETGNDGLTLLSSFWSSPFEREILMLYEITPDGDIVWNKFYNSPVGIAGSGGQVTYDHLKRDANGNYYFLSNEQSAGSRCDIIKTDATGNVQWSKRYLCSGFNHSQFTQIDLDTKGNLYASMWLSQGSTSLQSSLLKINTSDGEVRQAWGESYNAGIYSKFLCNMKCVNDNRILTTPFVSGVGAAIMSTDSTGIGICGFSEKTFSTEPYTLSDTVITPFLMNPNIQVSEMTFSVEGMSNTLSPYCLNADIAEQFTEEAFQFVPNPFVSTATILFDEEQTDLQISILDLSGKVLKSIDFRGKELTIDRSGLSSGVYLLQVVNSRNEIAVRKIIVE